MSVDIPDLSVSSRDEGALRVDLERWLQGHERAARIVELHRPSGNGLSSETLLFDAEIGGQLRHLVARVEPPVDDLPVFPVYDLAMQYRVMELVGNRSAAPVPVVRWFEPDAAAIGAPFFVMDRVEGRVPTDNPPYTWEGWLLDAAPHDRRHLQERSVEALAAIHATDLTGVDTSFLEFPELGPSALHRHVAHWRAYYQWALGGQRVPVIDETFAWLDAHWPADDGGPSVLNWGDARIGNVLFDGFEPAAVLDWEMAGLGPRGIDLGWMVYLHAFFQELAETFGMAGTPGFLDADDAAATYAAASGVEVDLEWWVVYAAVRYAVIMKRVHRRTVAFGGAAANPDDPEDGMLIGDSLRRLIGG